MQQQDKIHDAGGDVVPPDIASDDVNCEARGRSTIVTIHSHRTPLSRKKQKEAERSRKKQKEAERSRKKQKEAERSRKKQKTAAAGTKTPSGRLVPI